VSEETNCADSALAYLERCRRAHGSGLSPGECDALAELLGEAAAECRLVHKMARALGEGLKTAARFVHRYPPPGHDRAARDARLKTVGMMTELDNNSQDTEREVILARTRAMARALGPPPPSVLRFPAGGPET